MAKLIEARLFIKNSFVVKYNEGNMPCDLKAEAARIANLTRSEVKIEYDYNRDRNVTKQEAFTFYPDGAIEIPNRHEVERITGKDEPNDDTPF